MYMSAADVVAVARGRTTINEIRESTHVVVHGVNSYVCAQIVLITERGAAGYSVKTKLPWGEHRTFQFTNGYASRGVIRVATPLEVLAMATGG